MKKQYGDGDCSICGDQYSNHGHNAWPYQGRCCDQCNEDWVVVARAWGNGRLSDMTNHPWAKDAVACFMETEERRQRGWQRPSEGRLCVKGVMTNKQLLNLARNQHAKEGAPGGVTSSVAEAKVFDISKRSVVRAKRILEKAKPKDIAAIKNGDATVHGADNKIIKNKSPKREAQYHERFLRSLAVAAQACRTLRDTKIPPLSKNELRSSITEIAESRKVLGETLEELRRPKMKLDKFDTRQRNER